MQLNVKFRNLIFLTLSIIFFVFSLPGLFHMNTNHKTQIQLEEVSSKLEQTRAALSKTKDKLMILEESLKNYHLHFDTISGQFESLNRAKASSAAKFDIEKQKLDKRLKNLQLIRDTTISYLESITMK